MSTLLLSPPLMWPWVWESVGLFCCMHGGWRQPMCDPEECSTGWGALGGGGTPPPSEGGGGTPPPPSLSPTQHLFRQVTSKRANTQS